MAESCVQTTIHLESDRLGDLSDQLAGLVHFPFVKTKEMPHITCTVIYIFVMAPRTNLDASIAEPA